jgi:fumarate reductase subunit D
VRRRLEPYLWLLFSAGGVAAALALPVLVLLFGVLMPLGALDWPSGAWLGALLDPPVVRVALVAVVVLCLFHAAHRIRFTSEELLGLRRYDVVIAVLCYGSAIAGGVITALRLL